MTTYTVNDDLITSAQAEAYFENGDRRIKLGMRACLELLRIPLPEYAKRKPTGPKTKSAALVAASYAADHGRVIKPYEPRKPNATPEVVAAAIAKRSSLYDETFG